MVRLSDVVPNEREHLENLDCPVFDQPAMLPAQSLTECRVALISSAGLMSRSQPNVHGSTTDYRTIDAGTRDRDLLMNHISVNFDRTGFAADTNCVFPRERLNELASSNLINSAASDHYSFMGATPPQPMKENVDRLVATLKKENVNAVCLLPV